MNKFQRVRSIIWGILMITFSIGMIVFPNDGYVFMTMFISIFLLMLGVKKIGYYFSMARHMVGGKKILFEGVILLDFGIFTCALSDLPKIYVVLYLLGCNGFAGIANVLKGIEAKKLGAPSWKLSTSQGAVSLMLAVFSLIFVKKTNVFVYMYCLGVIYSGIVRIITAFRKTAIIYIQ